MYYSFEPSDVRLIELEDYEGGGDTEYIVSIGTPAQHDKALNAALRDILTRVLEDEAEYLDDDEAEQIRTAIDSDNLIEMIRTVEWRGYSLHTITPSIAHAGQFVRS